MNIDGFTSTPILVMQLSNALDDDAPPIIYMVTERALPFECLFATSPNWVNVEQRHALWPGASFIGQFSISDAQYNDYADLARQAEATSLSQAIAEKGSKLFPPT